MAMQSTPPAQQKKSRWMILGGLALVLIAGLGLWYWKRHSDANQKTTYRVSKAERGSIGVRIQSTGVVAPENRLEIKPPIPGRVEKVLAKEGDVIKKGRVLAWMSSSERAALLDAATARGPEELKKWEDLYKATPILAPINGTLILRNVEPGQTFTTSDAVFVMSDRLTIKAQVDETDIGRIKLKQKANATLDAYPTQGVSAVVDKIAFDSKTVNNVTTYVVDVLPEKTPDFMRSGMTANVTFEGENKEDVVLVPADAVLTQNGQSYVLKGEEGKDPNTAELAPAKTPIKTGISDGKKVEVVSGLEGGETLWIPNVRATEKRSGTSPFGPPGGSGRRQGSGPGSR